MTTRPKRRVKINKPKRGIPDSMDNDDLAVDLPECPTHSGYTMYFDAADFLWHCAWDTCKITIMPRKDTERGEPLVGQGDIELVLLHENDVDPPQVFLRALGNNVLINITSLMNPNGLKQIGSTHTFNIMVDKINRISGVGVEVKES